MLASRWWTDLKNPISRIACSACRWVHSGLLLLLLFGSGSALALPEDACIKDDRCKEHYTKASKLYKEEYFDEALAEFQAAYEARQMPLLLVNIGRTYQKLGRPKEALSFYERYLQAESKFDPDVRKRVDEYISQVKVLIGTAEDKTDKPTPDLAKPTAAVPPPPQPPPPGRNLLIAGAVIGGVGLVAGIVADSALGAAYQNQINTFNSSTDEFDKLAARSSAQSYGNGIVVATILGLAAAGTGAALIAVGATQLSKHRQAQAGATGPEKPATTEPPAQPHAMLAPWASSSGAGLVLFGGF